MQCVLGCQALPGLMTKPNQMAAFPAPAVSFDASGVISPLYPKEEVREGAV